MANTNKVNMNNLSFSNEEDKRRRDIEDEIEAIKNHLYKMQKGIQESTKIYDLLMNPSKSKLFTGILLRQDTLIKQSKSNQHELNKQILELEKEIKLKQGEKKRVADNAKYTYKGRSANFKDIDTALKYASKASNKVEGQDLANLMNKASGLNRFSVDGNGNIVYDDGSKLNVIQAFGLRSNNKGGTKGAAYLSAQNKALAMNQFEALGITSRGTRTQSKRSEKMTKKLSNEIFDLQRKVELAKTKLKTSEVVTDAKTKQYQALVKAGEVLYETSKRVVKVVSDSFKAIGLNFANVTKDVLNEISQAFSKSGIASYSIGTSLFTNSAARTNQMKYGLSSTSNYAMMQTMSILGMSDENDLLYMNSNQREMFRALTNYYKARYAKLQKSGALEAIQKAQIDFQIFKQELSYKFLNWFAQHKEQIMKFITNIMRVMDIILPVLLKVMTIVANVISRLGGLFGSTSSAYLQGVSGTNVNLNYTQNNAIQSTGTNQQLLDLLKQNTTLGAKEVMTQLNGKY